jgi:hypothetical protein
MEHLFSRVQKYTERYSWDGNTNVFFSFGTLLLV